MENSLETLRSLHRQALSDVESLLTAVQVDALALPTPCTAWTLRDLLEHMIGQNHGFADAAAGTPTDRAAFAPIRLPAATPDPAGGNTVRTAWAESADRLITAFAKAPEDGSAHLPEIAAEPFPIGFAVGFQLVDSVVHAWDVATALGVHYRPTDDLIAGTVDWALLVPGGDVRDAPDRAFARELPTPDDDPWHRILTHLGRTP